VGSRKGRHNRDGKEKEDKDIRVQARAFDTISHIENTSNVMQNNITMLTPLLNSNILD
jgi:hypothetical protein